MFVLFAVNSVSMEAVPVKAVALIKAATVAVAVDAIVTVEVMEEVIMGEVIREMESIGVIIKILLQREIKWSRLKIPVLDLQKRKKGLLFLGHFVYSIQQLNRAVQQ